uniref:Ovule protein n=1 Tax=Rodentolepis nana TaxID=102285 RepID=A0A0R3TZT0_RODNA
LPGRKPRSSYTTLVSPTTTTSSRRHSDPCSFHPCSPPTPSLFHSLWTKSYLPLSAGRLCTVLKSSVFFLLLGTHKRSRGGGGE